MSTYWLEQGDVLENAKAICNGVGKIEVWELKFGKYTKEYKSKIFFTNVVKALFLDNNK